MVGPVDGVEHAQPADGERHHSGALAVGGAPGIELVAAAEVGEPRLGDEVVEQGQVEVTGDGEHAAPRGAQRDLRGGPAPPRAKGSSALRWPRRRSLMGTP